MPPELKPVTATAAGGRSSSESESALSWMLERGRLPRVDGGARDGSFMDVPVALDLDERDNFMPLDGVELVLSDTMMAVGTNADAFSGVVLISCWIA